MAKSFVQLYRWLTPGWLRWGEGDAVLRSLSQLIDEYVLRLRDGIARRFPTYAAAALDDEALAKIGRDRGIPRGRNETAAHYAARLIEWRYPRGHRVRGSAFALLTQISEYFGGVQCWTIDANGTRHGRSATGAEYVDYAHPWTWDDRPASEWSRFWVVVDGSSFARAQPEFGATELWGGAAGTSGYTIGQLGVTFEDVQAIRRLLTGRAWRPAGTQPMWLILTLDPLHGPFADPESELYSEHPALPYPDATWQHWSNLVDGEQVPTRDDRFRYWSLAPEHTSNYPGNSTRFAAYLTLASEALYSGDPDNFPATITLASGASYAGNPNNFPTPIRIPDDGDPPWL